jgi:hypothetical protein
MSDIILFPLSAEKFEQAGVPVRDVPGIIAPSVPFGRNIRDKAFFEATIAGEWRKSVGSIVRIGQLLNEAHDVLSQEDFNSLKLSFSKRTAFALRRIARHPVISDPVRYSSLPPCWRTLDLIITLASPDSIREAIDDKRINPDLQQKDVRRALGLPPKPAGSKRKTDGLEEEDALGGETPVNAPATWAGFSVKDKRAILDSEGRAGLVKLLSPRVAGDLADHLLGLQAFGAATNTKRATALTAILRAMLAAANGDEMLAGMRAQLQKFKLTAADVSVAVHRKKRGR